MAATEHFDILIIGAGPIGLACGIEAQKAGLSYLIVDKGPLVSSLFHYPVFMTFFSTSEKLEIGGVPFVSISPKPSRNEALEYYRRVAGKFKLNIHLFEEVIGLQHNEIFTVFTNKANYTCNKVIVATGFYDIPNKIGVLGEELPKVKHYYQDPHLYAFSKVAVIGANNSAVDVALETFRKGAEVTMIIRGDDFGSVKYWVLPDIKNRINEGEVKAYFNSEVAKITENEIEINTPNGIVKIKNDFVLAMTGYQPNFEMLKLFGIALNEDKTPVYNEETMETNVKGLYLAGVVCGGLNTRKWFIENSRIHAEQIFTHLNKGLSK